jgi:hypothetical protein
VAPSISLYNHTSRLFANGSNESSDNYRVMLCTAATFNATDATLAGITKTEVASGTGYTSGGGLLANVTVTSSLNDAKFDADDVTWTASGGSIIASFGILYNQTAGDLPLAFINFDGVQTAGDGTQFKVIWNSGGIFTFNVG